jgi:hypothetical protein
MRDAMPQRRRKALEGNSVLLLEELLTAISHPDSELNKQNIVAGFSITGDMPRSGVFRPLEPGELQQGHPKEWLWQRARDIRRTALAPREHPRRARPRRGPPSVREDDGRYWQGVD